MTPLVSICMPCYHAEQYVAAAVQSALDQTWPNKEIIIVDAGSTDGSGHAIVHHYVANTKKWYFRHCWRKAVA